jgi:hypothetical protein
MQKSDFALFQTNLAELWQAGEEINLLLENNQELSLAEIDQVDKLYLKRAELLANIDQWRKTSAGNEIISKNFEIWNKVIKKIADIDKKNLDILEKSVKITASKLRELNKQKSLLLYNKESVKWI